jgi:hypothetical protein
MLSPSHAARALGGTLHGNQIRCPGPGHTPDDRSLMVWLLPDGSFTVHSHAGDDPIVCKDHVRQKLGLESFETSTSLPDNHETLARMAENKRKANGDGGTTASAGPRELVATYDYKDRDGALLYQVRRYNPKDFSQHRPDGKGGWLPGQGDRRVPYRWPDLVAAEWNNVPLFVCEGEKDADRVASLGHCATTVANGNWKGVDVSDMAGRDVLILQDNDDAGRKRAQEAARALHGVAKTIRIVELPGLPMRGDVSDWLDADPTNAERLAEVCFEAPVWAPEEDSKAKTALDEIFDGAELMQAEFAPVKYAVPGVIVEGLTLFAGKPKIGKSWLLLHAANAIATNGFTLGDLHCHEGDVLYCSLEDNKRRLKDRMQKLLGVRPPSRRLQFLTKMPRLAEGGLELLRQWLQKHPQARMIGIDTLAMVRMPNRKDQSAYDADYAALVGLRKLAQEFEVAIVVVHHLRKMEAEDAFDTVSGTLGLTGCTDSIVILKRDAAGTMLLVRGRDLEEAEKAISFNKNTCAWTILGDADDLRRSTQQQAILIALREAGEPQTLRQIAAAANMKQVNVRKVIGRMVEDGAVRRVGRGKYDLASQGSQTGSQ